jgi:hypothetical protein
MSTRTEDVNALAAAVDLAIDPGAASIRLFTWSRRHPMAVAVVLGLVLVLTATAIAYLPSLLVAAISTTVAIAWCASLPPDAGGRQPRFLN